MPKYSCEAKCLHTPRNMGVAAIKEYAAKRGYLKVGVKLSVEGENKIGFHCKP